MDCRKYSFTHRVKDEWNNLTEDVAACENLNLFKNKTRSMNEGPRVYINLKRLSSPISIELKIKLNCDE
jgi:hypothetical protein